METHFYYLIPTLWNLNNSKVILHNFGYISTKYNDYKLILGIKTFHGNGNICLRCSCLHRLSWHTLREAEMKGSQI